MVTMLWIYFCIFCLRSSWTSFWNFPVENQCEYVFWKQCHIVVVTTQLQLLATTRKRQYVYYNTLFFLLIWFHWRNLSSQRLSDFHHYSSDLHFLRKMLCLERCKVSWLPITIINYSSHQKTVASWQNVNILYVRFLCILVLWLLKNSSIILKMWKGFLQLNSMTLILK